MSEVDNGRNRRAIAPRGGFTLVEVVVVLVILGVLAGIALPQLTQYVGKADRTAVMAECRSCVMAAETLLAEDYAATGELKAPDASAVQSLAGAAGTVSDMEVDARLTHLTYTRGGLSVTYCALPGSCPNHDALYNFGGGTGGSGESGGGGGSGAGGSGGVTLTDSAGSAHTLQVTGSWATVKASITGAGWNTENGALLSDGTGTYLCYGWSHWIREAGDDSLTLAALAAKYPDQFEKVTADTRIWCESDIRNGKWISAPQKGDLCCYGGSYYVAPTAIGQWSLPPGQWIQVTQ